MLSPPLFLAHVMLIGVLFSKSVEQSYPKKSPLLCYPCSNHSAVDNTRYWNAYEADYHTVTSKVSVDDGDT